VSPVDKPLFNHIGIVCHQRESEKIALKFVVSAGGIIPGYQYNEQCGNLQQIILLEVESYANQRKVFDE